MTVSIARLAILLSLLVAGFGANAEATAAEKVEATDNAAVCNIQRDAKTAFARACSLGHDQSCRSTNGASATQETRATGANRE